MSEETVRARLDADEDQFFREIIRVAAELLIQKFDRIDDTEAARSVANKIFNEYLGIALRRGRGLH